MGAIRVGNLMTSVAQSGVNGHTTMIAVDKVVAKIKAAGLDVDDPDDNTKIQNLVEHIVAHEPGHNLGLRDDDSSSKKDMLMNDSIPGLSDQIYRDISQDDIDKAAAALK